MNTQVSPKVVLCHKIILFCMLSSVILLTGCQRVTPSSGPSYRTMQTPNHRVRVDFIDAEAFDEGLAAAMRTGHAQIWTQPVTPFDVNSMPPRMKRWLAAVSKNGGSVRVEPNTRSLELALWLGQLLYEILYEVMLYQSAKNYDAVLYYDYHNRQVYQILFMRRYR